MSTDHLNNGNGEDTPKKKKKKWRMTNSSRAEISERRHKIQKLRLKGHTYTEISQMLEIPLATVGRDMDQIQKAARDRITLMQQNEVLGTTLSVLEEVRDKAWEQYDYEGNNGLMRLKALDLIRNIEKDAVEILKDCGVIGPRPPTKVEHTFKLDLPNWDARAKEAFANALISRALPPLAEPEADPNEAPIIDVEPIVNESGAKNE